MAKVRLFYCGGYSGLNNVSLPVDIEAKMVTGGVARIPGSELLAVGANVDVISTASMYNFYIGSECELITDTPAPSNPQATDLAIHCNGIDEVSHSRTSGFKQMVTLTDACVEDVIENIGADRFFAAFDNEELAEHLRKYGYEVTKND